MLLAYHGKEEVKEKYLARLSKHRLADELIHGVGWENGKGCAVGCTLEAYEHERYETELGIPQMLARLEDVIFEGLPNGEAQKWPERFLSAIKPGTDLSLVGWKFLFWLVEKTLREYGTDVVKKECASALDIVKQLSEGLPISIEAAESAWSAAWSAAESAESAAESARSAAESARSAAESAAWSAWSAAESARSAAESARSAAESAESAAWSAAESARSAVYKEMADKLEELLLAAV